MTGRAVAATNQHYDLELDDEGVFGLSSVAGTAGAVRHALGEQP